MEAASLRLRWLLRRNPCTQLWTLINLSLLACLGPTLLYPALVLLLLGLLGLGSGLFWRWLKRSALLLLPLLMLLLLIQGLLSPDGRTPVMLGPLLFWQEGLERALALGSRLSAALAAGVLLGLALSPHGLMKALEQRGAPAALGYICAATLELLPALRRRIHAIQEAQQARGLALDGRITQRIRALLPLLRPLVISTLIDSEERALALEARGFRSHRQRRFLYPLPDPIWEQYFSRLLPLLTLILLAAGYYHA